MRLICLQAWLGSLFGHSTNATIARASFVGSRGDPLPGVALLQRELVQRKRLRRRPWRPGLQPLCGWTVLGEPMLSFTA
eukprot:7547786-Alexandrium_andersonii.AAC.1